MKRSFFYSTCFILALFLISCEEKPEVPVLATSAVSEIGTESAVSGGVVTSDGGAPVTSKGICWGVTDDPTTSDNKTVENGESATFSCNLDNLCPKTVYYVRAYATNSAGTGYGESATFTTIGDIPGASSINSTNIAVDSARISGTVNPNSLSTNITFEWGTSTSYGNMVSLPNPVTGNISVNVSTKLTNLTPGTIYHYRIKAVNSLGTTYSSDMTFTTPGAIPQVTSQSKTNLTINSVTLNGLVNPNYLSTAVTFEWGTSTSYGNIASVSNPVTGATSVPVSVQLATLMPGTTYHYKIKAENSLGTTYSNDLTFTTLGAKPSVTMYDKTNLQVYSVTLNGLVNPNYLSTVVKFEYGTSTNYENSITFSQSPVTGNSGKDVSAYITGLTPGTTYHYRIAAINELGNTFSDDMTFKTLGTVPTVLSKDPSHIQYTTVTLHGSVNPNHLGSAVTFEWGTTESYGNTASASQNPISSGSSLVDVSAEVSGLILGTTYYYRISATNELGTTTSEDFTFTTLAPLVDIDGNSYNIRTLGNQVWMIENLKTTKYSDGNAISHGLYYPQNNASKVGKYGILYDWSAAIKQPAKYDTIMINLPDNNIQGVCPTGWHLPTVTEWLKLVDNYGGKANASLKLKIADQSYWNLPVRVEEPVSGFNAIPAGRRWIDGSYNVCGDEAAFWTSSQWGEGGGSIMGRQIYMFSHSPDVTINIANANNQPGSVGLSVRCVKD